MQKHENMSKWGAKKEPLSIIDSNLVTLNQYLFSVLPITYYIRLLLDWNFDLELEYGNWKILGNKLTVSVFFFLSKIIPTQSRRNGFILILKNVHNFVGF